VIRVHLLGLTLSIILIVSALILAADQARIARHEMHPHEHTTGYVTVLP